jgi:hypothetical protein
MLFFVNKEIEQIIWWRHKSYSKIIGMHMHYPNFFVII